MENYEIYDILSGEGCPNIVNHIMKELIKKKYEVHEYHNKSKSGYIQTQFYANYNGQKIKKSTPDKVWDEIERRMKEKEKSPSIETLYGEWEKKKVYEVNKNTIIRNRQVFNQFISGSDLAKMPINTITEANGEDIANRLIVDSNMSKKNWTNVKTILNGIGEMAKKNKDIEYNFAIHLEPSTKRFKPVHKRTAEEAVFSRDEIEEFKKFVKEWGAVSGYAALVQLLTGARMGEIKALKWEDVDLERKTITFRRQRTRDAEGSHETTYEHTKGHEEHTLPISDEVVSIISGMPKVSEYVFIYKGKLITTPAYNYVLKKFATETGKEKAKLSHTLRRTYATFLAEENVPVPEIQKMMRHSDIRTTMGYISYTGKSEALSNALEKLAG